MERKRRIIKAQSGTQMGNQRHIDQLKASGRIYNVDDFSYRVNKLHPEISKDQVSQVYDNTAIKTAKPGIQRLGNATANLRGGVDGAYVRGQDVSPTTFIVSQNHIPSSREYGLMDEGSARSLFDQKASSTIAHETNHAYADQLLNNQFTPQEEQLLREAYGDVFNAGDANDLLEMRATNAQLRQQLATQGNRTLTGKALDKAIYKADNNKLMKMYLNTNGYTQDKTGKYKQILSQPGKIDKIKKAMDLVADNGNNNFQQAENSYFAKMGGSIPPRRIKKYGKLD